MDELHAVFPCILVDLVADRVFVVWLPRDVPVNEDRKAAIGNRFYPRIIIDFWIHRGVGGSKTAKQST